MTSASDFDRMVIYFMEDDPLTAYYIHQSGEAVFDPATGENVVTTIETPVQAILLDLIINSAGLSSKFGTTILAGDKELYVRPPEKTNPLNLPLKIDTTNDRVRVSGITYKVVAMKAADPTGEAPILYNFQLRR